MKATVIFLIASALGTSLAGAQATQKLTATKASDYGIVYSLPKTLFDITIEAEQVVRKPGEFYNYAKKYLNADNPITQSSTSWELKSVTIVPRSEADTDEQYQMVFKAGSSPFLILNADNIPLAINTDKTVETAEVKLPVAQPALPTALDGPAAHQAVTEEMLQSPSLAKRAELAAAQIYSLRQSRNDLITGQADQMPPDGKAMQIVMDNIAAQEAALTAMFLGTEQRSTDVATFTYTPGEEVTNDVVARLSVLAGIVDPDDLSGSPIYLDLKVLERGKIPLNEKGEEKKLPKGAVVYNIPGTARITIHHNGKTFAEITQAMPQYGIQFGADPALFSDKKAPAYLIFDPLTGGVRELGSATAPKE